VLLVNLLLKQAQWQVLVMVCKAPSLVKHQCLVVPKHPLKVAKDIFAKLNAFVRAFDGYNLLCKLVDPFFELSLLVSNRIKQLQGRETLAHFKVARKTSSLVGSQLPQECKGTLVLPKEAQLHIGGVCLRVIDETAQVIAIDGPRAKPIRLRSLFVNKIDLKWVGILIISRVDLFFIGYGVHRSYVPIEIRPLSLLVVELHVPLLQFCDRLRLLQSFLALHHVCLINLNVDSQAVLSHHKKLALKGL